MSATIKKAFDSPDETRNISKGKVEVINLGDVQAMRAIFEPGWRWSESVKPIAGTDSCQVAHKGYVIAGRMGIKMDDGSEFEMGPGDAYDIPAGHDGWVIGDDNYVGVDFSPAMQEYAKK